MIDLLIKYYLKETNIEETASVEEWLAASDENKKELTRLKLIWENSGIHLPTSPPDVIKAWQHFQERKALVERNTVRKFSLRRRYKNAIAASVSVLLVLSGWFVYNNLTAPVVWATTTVAKVITLPDRSVITLNKQSKLTYHKDFNKQTRKVTLEGEGFFKVSHNPQKPFLVTVKDVEVKVIGTSFNINEVSDKLEIQVETGIVAVTKNSKTNKLKAHEKITFTKNNEEGNISAINNRLYQYYRTKVFVCDHTPVPDLVNTLKEAYNADIVLSKQGIEQQQITSKYAVSEDLESILNNIAITLNAQLVKKGNTYILK